jgi:maleylpyruvate isomerase
VPQHLRGGEGGVTGPPATLDWWAEGERTLATALGRLTDEEFDGPSRLPGWSRGTVLAHVARNADALVNLLGWARTGVETPMYASPQARDAGIAETAALPPAPLRAEVVAATDRLAAAVRELPEPAWSAVVRTAQGRAVPTSEVLWMRCRETWVHAVDLDAGIGFDAVPDDVLAALVDDVFRMWERRGHVPDVTVFAGDRTWGSGGSAVSGSLAAVAGWVTGRTPGAGLDTDDGLPELPAWL